MDEDYEQQAITAYALAILDEVFIEPVSYLNEHSECTSNKRTFRCRNPHKNVSLAISDVVLSKISLHELITKLKPIQMFIAL
jgi:hypothetical protein